MRLSMLVLTQLVWLFAVPLAYAVQADDAPQAETKEEAKEKDKDEEQKKKEEAQKKTIEAIKQLGGRVEIDYTQRDVQPYPVKKVRINRATTGDEALEHVKQLTKLKNLDLNFSNITDS